MVQGIAFTGLIKRATKGEKALSLVETNQASTASSNEYRAVSAVQRGDESAGPTAICVLSHSADALVGGKFKVG